MAAQSEVASPLSRILDEHDMMPEVRSFERPKFLNPVKMLDDNEREDAEFRVCTDNVFKIEDPEAKHRLKMIIQGEEQVPQVRDILNWPSSLSYRFKSLLGAIMSPRFMMKCLKLPTFAFFTIEAALFLGIILLPVFVLESVFYPVFRLLFGVLYPAYASYKAVRTRDVKKYVSWGENTRRMDNN